MRRLFIVGASILQLPAIKKAKEMGLYVGVADYDPGAIGIAYADEYFTVSTIDENGICEAARAFGADGIITLATDMPMRSVALACERLGLIGVSYDTAVKSTDKGEMIRAFEANGVEHPWFQIVDRPDELSSIAASLTFPCIAKPVDNSGSRGVVLVADRSQLQEAVAYSSREGRSGSVILEEYMVGPEVSVEVIVVGGVPQVIQVTDKLTTGAPHFVEMGHSQPSQLPEWALSAVHDLAKRAVLAVGIDNGPAHVEIIVTEQGPKVVELGARLGGDCITTHLVPLSTGVDLVGDTIRMCLGELPDPRPVFSRGSAIRYLAVPGGTVTRITGLEKAQEIDGVVEVTLLRAVGDRVRSIASSADRVGYVIAQGITSAQAVAACELARSCISVYVDWPGR